MDADDYTQTLKDAVVTILQTTTNKPKRILATLMYAEVSLDSTEDYDLVPRIEIEFFEGTR